MDPNVAGGNPHSAPDSILLVLEQAPNSRTLAGLAALETCHFVQRSTGRLTVESYAQLHELEAYLWQKQVAPDSFGSVYDIYLHVSRSYRHRPIGN
jgi:hypothetical protein